MSVSFCKWFYAKTRHEFKFSWVRIVESITESENRMSGIVTEIERIVVSDVFSYTLYRGNRIGIYAMLEGFLQLRRYSGVTSGHCKITINFGL